MNDCKKTTRLAYLSGNNINPHRFDFVEPCFENIDEFFSKHAEWLDTETDISREYFSYTGHGTFDQETIKDTTLVPTLKLGLTAVNQFLNDGDCLEKYYQYSWKYLGLDKLVDCFIDDLEQLETLPFFTIKGRAGAVTWDAVALLFHLFVSHKDRLKCLRLAVKRAGEAITTRSIVLACAETIHARRA